MPASAILSKLRDRSGLSLEKVAKEAGFSRSSSVQRYFSEEQPIAELKIPIASRLARVLIGRGNPPITIIDLAATIGLHIDPSDHAAVRNAEKLLNVNGNNKDDPLASDPHVAVGRIPVVGASNASYWMPSAPSIDTPEDWLHVPEWVTPPPGHYALRIVGTSINRTAHEGHYAICQRYGGDQQKPPEGRFAHVERQRGGEIEWTIKRVRWSEDGPALWPDSTDPKWQKPIPLGDGEDDVSILGIVIGWYKPA